MGAKAPKHKEHESEKKAIQKALKEKRYGK